VDWLIRSGIWVGACAVALLLAASRSMGGDPSWSLIAVTGLGTVAVYGFDRWAVDRSGPPFWLLPLLPAVILGLRLPAAAVAILICVCGLALVHARLRDLPWTKPLYITVAWIGVVIGVPWVLRGSGPVPGALGPLALAIVANVLACDAVDREAEAAQIDPRQIWWLARFLALTGVVVALMSPGAEVIAAVPGMLVLALIPWPVSRRWAERGLDGALLAGALLASLMMHG
jgi:hypothetical protein